MGDFTEAVARYSEAVHTARGHGGNFHIGVAKRFAKWGEANGWSPDSVPADALETWTSSSLAQGKQHRAVEKERVLLGDFLGFLQTGDLGVAQPQGGNGISVSTEIPDEVPADEAPAGDTSGIDPVASALSLTQTPPVEPQAQVPVPVPIQPKPVAKPVQRVPARRDLLADVLPAPGRIRVYRREPLGALSPINEYNADDVSGEGPIAFFLRRYVEPQYGPGTYEVYRVAATGQDQRPGWRIVLASQGGAPQGAFGQAAQPAQPAPGAIAQLKELLEVVETLQKRNVSVPPDLQKKIDDIMLVVRPPQGVAVGVAHSPNEMVNQLLNVHYTDQLMETIRARRADVRGDPVAEAKLFRLERDLEDLKRSTQATQVPAVALPPPPPQVDMAAVVQSVASSMRPEPRPDPYDGMVRVLEKVQEGQGQVPPPPDPVAQLGALVTALSPLLPKPEAAGDRVAALERKLDAVLAGGSSGVSKIADEVEGIVRVLSKLGISGPFGPGSGQGVVQLARDVIMNAPQIADAATKVILAARGLGRSREATPEDRAFGAAVMQTSVPPKAEVALRALTATTEPSEVTALVFEAVHAFATDSEWGPKLAPAVQRLQGGNSDAVKQFVRNLLSAAGLNELATEELLDRVTKSLLEILPQVST